MNKPPVSVLVVDDEIQIRRFPRAGFELEGFAVHEAASAAPDEDCAPAGVAASR